MEGRTIYYEGESVSHHTEDMCDRCGKDVGSKHLKPLSFLYMNKNDKFHKDMSQEMEARTGREWEPGYRHYRCCKDCWE